MTTISISPRVRGFTLIELMVIVVIAGILAAVAIPSYSSYIVRSKRSAAKTAVVEAANILERNRSMNGCYNKTSIPACQSQAAGNDFALNVTMAPAQRGSYVITLPAATLSATTFTLNATPCGTAGTCPAGNDTAFADAECGTFTLTELGVRNNSSNTLAVATCWDR